METLLNGASVALKQISDDAEIGKRSVVSEQKGAQLPPSSYQSFLKKKRDIAGFVLRPFGQQFVYKLV